MLRLRLIPPSASLPPPCPVHISSASHPRAAGRQQLARPAVAHPTLHRAAADGRLPCPQPVPLRPQPCRAAALACSNPPAAHLFGATGLACAPSASRHSGGDTAGAACEASRCAAAGLSATPAWHLAGRGTNRGSHEPIGSSSSGSSGRRLRKWAARHTSSASEGAGCSWKQQCASRRGETRCSGGEARHRQCPFEAA